MEPSSESNSLLATACKSLGLLFGVTASCCFVFMTTTPCWYATFAEASISPYKNCHGLWKFCSSTGLCGKWLSGSLLGPHGAQRTACRGFMITACLLSGLAMIFNVFGMRCVRLFTISKKGKEMLVKKSVFLWIIAGTLVLISSTWYALYVMHSVWDEGRAMELSDGIFVGWGAAAISYAAAAFLWIGAVISQRHRKRETKRRNSMIASVSAAAECDVTSGDMMNSCFQHFDTHGSEASKIDGHLVHQVRIIEPMRNVIMCAGHSRTTYM